MICIVCGGDRFRRMTDPHPSRAMLSDFAIVMRPLGKYGCLRCGLTVGVPPPEHHTTFGADYSLYAHDPGDPHEVARQAGYAGWLARALPAPTSMFEAGAGNGSLLLALRDVWADSSAKGIEAASRAVTRGQKAGVAIEHGFLEPAPPNAPTCDLAFAINVIEHTLDPVAFVRDLATHGTTVAIVCPDGDTANTELLVADHLFSFGRSHMRSIVAAAGLRVTLQVSAPGAIGSFFLTVASKGTPHANSVSDAGALLDLKDDYLGAWRALDDILARRLGESRQVGCFGAGEAAALLRAYAPAVWERVSACVMDAPSAEQFGAKPIKAYSPDLAADTYIVATRPAVQALIAARLERDGKRVVRYDDRIEA